MVTDFDHDLAEIRLGLFIVKFLVHSLNNTMAS